MFESNDEAPAVFRITYTDMSEQCSHEGFFSAAQTDVRCHTLEDLKFEVRELEARIREKSKDFTKRFKPVITEIVQIEEVDENLWKRASEEGVEIGANRLRAREIEAKNKKAISTEDRERAIYEALRKKYETP